MQNHAIDVTLQLEDGYQFTVDFGQEALSELLVDEPPPLGQGHGPNASRMLAAAVGNCLGASLLFCLRKARVDARDLRVRVRGNVERNDNGRFRIPDIGVAIDLQVPPEQRQRTGRCLEIFEDFCLVTQSVRNGINITVDVDVADGILSGTDSRGIPAGV